MKRRETIFNLNHIDTERSEAEIKKLKEFDKFYHKKAWCYNKSFKHAKFLDHATEFTGIFLVVVGTVTGGITLNPIVFGVLNGLGLALTSLSKMKNYKRKMEMAKIAYLTYEKILVELRSALRGNEFDEKEFLDKMKAVDEMIIDQTPLTDKYEKKYKKNSKRSLGTSKYVSKAYIFKLGNNSNRIDLKTISFGLNFFLLYFEFFQGRIETMFSFLFFQINNPQLYQEIF